MEIALNPKTERLVKERLATGDFASAEEFLQAAVESFVTEPDGELDEETTAAIDEGLAQANRGETRPWAEVRKELAAKHKLT